MFRKSYVLSCGGILAYLKARELRIPIFYVGFTCASYNILVIAYIIGWPSEASMLGDKAAHYKYVHNGMHSKR